MEAPIVHDRASELARKQLARINAGGSLTADELTYVTALITVVEGLQKYGPYSATPVLLDEPRVRIDPDGCGYQLYGCLHVLPDLVFGEVPLEFPTSYHYYGWAARRAARKWTQWARPIAARLAVELEGCR